MEKRLTLPMTREKAATMKIGEIYLLTGTIYTGRDAAHKRLVDLLDAGKSLPFPVEDSVIYYTGPAPARPGHVIGSAGPTTSYRMDAYAPRLLALGMRGMIGKGKRSAEVVEAMKKAGAVYLGATGGAGALLAQRIKKAKVIAFEDLGTEAVRELYVEDFPVTVVIDCAGNNLYEQHAA